MCVEYNLSARLKHSTEVINDELYHKSFRFGTEVFTSIIGGALRTLMVDRKLEWFQNHLLSIVQVRS